MHPQYRITCTYFITTSHIIHLFGLYAAYLILRCWPWDSSASPMSSTNPLSEWSSQTPSKVCLCTKNSTTIYCNQTLCIGRGTWGALCALLPCGEIAVNTFPPPFSDRGSVVRQPCSVHYPPLPHWAETPRHIRNSTFTTFGSSNAHGENGCWFLYILRLPPHPARLSFRCLSLALGWTFTAQNQGVREQIGFTAFFGLQAKITPERLCECEIWFPCYRPRCCRMKSATLLLRLTTLIWWRKTNVWRCLACKSN